MQFMIFADGSGEGFAVHKGDRKKKYEYFSTGADALAFLKKEFSRIEKARASIPVLQERIKELTKTEAENKQALADAQLDLKKAMDELED